VKYGYDMLREAGRVIKDRGESYGPMHENMDRIAKMWAVLLGTPVTPSQVAMCMIAVKLARLVETPQHQDSVTDIAGYAAVLRECQIGPISVSEGKETE
jgi:hypothetical protein